MSIYRPNTVVTIAAQRCVILRDAVTHILPPTDDIVVLERAHGKLIYCALSVLNDAREQYPELPAYGFWQVLLHAGVIDHSVRLQTVYCDREDGQYLYQGDDGVAFSGEIRAGRLIANGVRAVDAHAAQVVNCDPQKLRLPHNPALSFAEREQRRRWHKLRIALYCSAVAVSVCAALLTHHHRQQADETEHQAVRAALQVRIAALSEQRTLLRKTRIGNWPEQRRALDELLTVALAFERFTLAETPLGRAAIEVRVSAAAVSLPPPVDALVNSVQHRKDGTLSLKWNGVR